MRRFLRVAVLTAVAGLLIAACGSPLQSRASPTQPAVTAPPSPTPSAVPTATPPPPTAAPAPSATPTTGGNPTAPPAAGAVSRCLVSELSLAAGGAGNAAAGTVGEPFVLTNTSQTTCALYGYPGMLMLGPGGQPIPTRVVWVPGPEQTVTLAPGAKASFLAWWHDQTGYQTPCPTSQQVEVTPPNAYAQLTVSASIQACPDGTINVNAVSAGAGGGQPT